MPVIKEEVLLKLYSELDSLKGDKENLQKGFVDLKVKSNKTEKQKKTNLIGLIAALIVLVAFVVYLYYTYTESELAIKETTQKEVVLLDSIQKLAILIPKNSNAEVVYSIQLGIYKNLDINFENKENTNFKKFVTNQGRAYQIGNFSSYKTATIFKEKLKEIGLKDVFLVPYNKKNERIDIKTALFLSNEEEFIKD